MRTSYIRFPSSQTLPALTPTVTMTMNRCTWGETSPLLLSGLDFLYVCDMEENIDIAATGTRYVL